MVPRSVYAYLLIKRKRTVVTSTASQSETDLKQKHKYFILGRVPVVLSLFIELLESSL